MKKLLGLGFVVLSSTILVWCCTTSKSTNMSVNVLPADADTTCTVSATAFRDWFADSTVSLNGIVTPANSVNFKSFDNCQFYCWSERMFLWMTSPLGNGSYVLETGQFYTVSPADTTTGNRSFMRNGDGPLQMTGQLLKNGPNRLPVMKSVSNRLFEIENAGEDSLHAPAVKDASGKTVLVGSVKSDGPGKARFFDKNGVQIIHPKALIRHTGSAFVHRFKAGDKTVFLDGQGQVIASEEGQATGDVLMARDQGKGKSIVYYLTLVNDMYAYYRTAVAQGSPMVNGNRFPTTAAERDSIVKFAAKFKVPMKDPNALTMEFKTSWVEASTLPDSSGYVIVSAEIPKYVELDPDHWIRTGKKSARMALVGMHVVGSAAGHPEMIWSTFEHQSNSPNASYPYNDLNKNTKVQPGDTGTNWMFSDNSPHAVMNISHMQIDTAKTGYSKNGFHSINGFKVSPSNTQRTYAWGAAEGQETNPQDTTAAASNTEVISMNNSVIKQLVKGDIRSNYLLIGASWTADGVGPTGYPYGVNDTLVTHKKADSTKIYKLPGATIGTSVMANSTMETYFQASTQSCFSCHSNNPSTPSLQPSILSHVFSNLQPLATVFKPVPATKKK